MNHKGSVKSKKKNSQRTYNCRQIGTQYERKAGDYLIKCGYEILEYNFRCRMGEIDIIARDGEYLVFCEVKYRSGEGQGDPAEAVDFRKQRRISKCAAYYLMIHGISDVLCRFDVVSMKGETISLIRNAFEYAV